MDHEGRPSILLRPLIEVLREVPYAHSTQERWHPLDAMLALACAAMVCAPASIARCNLVAPATPLLVTPSGLVRPMR